MKLDFALTKSYASYLKDKQGNLINLKSAPQCSLKEASFLLVIVSLRKRYSCAEAMMERRI